MAPAGRTHTDLMTTTVIPPHIAANLDYETYDDLADVASACAAVLAATRYKAGMEYSFRFNEIMRDAKDPTNPDIVREETRLARERIRNTIRYARRRHPDTLMPLFRDWLKDRRNHETAATVYVGAQPGAGKTRIRMAVAHRYGLNSADPDRMRIFHPDYLTLREQSPTLMADQTSALAGRLTARVCTEARDHGYGLAVEGTWRDPDAVNYWMQADKGRRILALGVATPPALSACAALQRGLDGGRWTNLGFVQAVNAATPANTRAITRLHAVDGFAVATWDNPVPTAWDATYDDWHDQWTRPLTDSEHAWCQGVIDRARRELPGTAMAVELDGWIWYVDGMLG